MHSSAAIGGVEAHAFSVEVRGGPAGLLVRYLRGRSGTRSMPSSAGGVSAAPKQAHVPDPERVALRLIFEPSPQLPLRAFSSLIDDLDGAYWLGADEPSNPAQMSKWWPPRSDEIDRDERLSSLAPDVGSVHFASPIDIVLHVPWEAWAASATAISGALAAIFATAPKLQEQRRKFWEERLKADRAKEAYVEHLRWKSGRRGIALVAAEWIDPPEDDGPDGSDDPDEPPPREPRRAAAAAESKDRERERA